jgi:chromosome segregation protein
MLRIEKLFLQGFKSFCDPTEIVLDQEGITAVVGPNGCGKSNVADAISWVIGEQRAKALRGGKMEDVIFQGSRNRQPAGMAEVLLTLVVRETFEIRGEAGVEAETQAVATAALAAQTTEQAVAIQAELAAPVAPDTFTTLPDSPALPIESSLAEPSAETTADQPAAPIAAIKKRRKVSAAATTRVFHEGERITVGRRLYRTGESEYEMNGRQCRLRDVQDLFAGTGLGGAHYAIIEQGRIGQVLSAKPMDRRALLEEAAGVSKFKLRQHAAELKLEAAKQNLSRLTDILTEIERQQNSLKRQAARARRYQRLRHELRDLLRAVYVVDYRHTRQSLAALEETLAVTTARATELTATMTELEAAQVQAIQAARAAEEELNEARQLAATCELEAARANQQHTYLTEQLQALGARQEQFVKDQSAIQARSQFIAQETARLRDELSKLEAQINTESKSLAEAEGDYRAQAGRDAAAEEQLEAQRQQVYETATRLERWRQLRQQFTEAVERNLTRLDGLRLERERAIAQAQTARDRYAALRASLEELETRQHHVAAQLSAVAEQLVELRRQRDERQHQLSQTQSALTATEQRLQSLTQIDERRTYFSEAVQVLTKSLTDKEGRTPDSSLRSVAADEPATVTTEGATFRVLGTLADFVRVAPEHEAMIESALRDELQYVVVPTFDDALRAIDFLKGQQAGRATFLVVGRQVAESNGATAAAYHSNQSYESPTTTLATLLGLHAEFADAFTFALPALAHAQIVDEPNEAMRASIAHNGSSHGLTSLARSGERVVAGRLITGGGGLGTGLGVLALKREISELTEQSDQLSSSVQTITQELQTAAAGIAQLEDEQRSWDSEARQLEKQLAVEREQWQQCQRELERTATHTRVVEQEMAQAETERQEAEAKQQHAASQTDEATAARTKAESVIEAAQAELAELRRVAAERLQELSRRRAEFAAQTERRRGLQNDLRRLENEAHELDSRLNRHRLESLETDDQTGQLQTALLNSTGELQQLTVTRERRTAELEQRAAALNTARNTADGIETELRQVRAAATQTREERMQAEIEKARLSSDLHHLIQACHTELGEDIETVCARLEANVPAPDESAAMLPPLEIAGDEVMQNDDDDSIEPGEISFWQIPEDFDLAQAKARTDELRAKIEALGPVNMMALEELTEIEERFSFLTAQRSDLEQAITDTQAAIAEIKRRSRERFQEAFRQINENFKAMFQELFGGGQGEMRLIDETDVLESGIEIIAQPPGKRLQNVLLLSGGEKAMTALALVLAIFKYRPSPFCLLDEVDAPLDEVNIGRFADKVTELSTRTQFMIITHSKRTMEAARTLYGVTMEDPGVSKLISVRFA